MHQVTYDVIIIGAGFAGLTAAYYLKEKDSQMNILIVEAKSRVGGKVESVELKVNKYGNKANFDIGGQWVKFFNNIK
jgi:protoporphyrinogen oxidase